MVFQASQASKVIGVSREKGDHQVHRVPKVLLGNKGRKVLGSQELLEPRVSQVSQEKKVTQELQEWLDLQELRALENQACQD